MLRLTTMDKDKFVEANGIKIHYVEEGEGLLCC